MITTDGQAKLMDFGIAREIHNTMTQLTGRTSQTPLYASPEQYEGRAVLTPASDIYSFSLVLYECLAGHPFVLPHGSLEYQILRKAFEALPSQSAGVNRILAAGLSKDPGKRPETAMELLSLAFAEPASLPADLIAVPDARYASLEGLAPGSQEAQERQRRAVSELGLPLEVKSRKTGIVLRLIPAGTFMMGDERSAEHEVTLTRPFYCGSFPVTQGHWESAVGGNPSHFKNVGSDAPAENVSWEDCEEFLKRLCQKEGVPKGTYRLLTESEWEYACRAGTSGAFCWGDNGSDLDGYAWYSSNSGNETHAVGQKRPNAWGLHDMHGNVWEWCNDLYGGYPTCAVTDPVGSSSGSSRVLRGGSWGYIPWGLRSADRHNYPPDWGRLNIGFRAARIP